MGRVRREQDTVRTDVAALLGDALGTVTLGGRYRLHHLLGVGGVAVVHEATDTRLDRRVAVKLLRETAADETDRARFVAEARLLASLSHPHLVRLLDAGIDDDRPFLVLELVRGRTLADVLEEPMPPARLARIGAEIASALAHAHAAGIVHRDVKPGNVLLADDGTALLADFGIARLVDDTRHHTSTGTVVGTVAYLAPEQVAGEQVTTAADVYAWGLVLLETLTGERAYTGSSVESALARLTRQPAVPDALPSQWRALLLAMTARHAAHRPTATEVASRLQAMTYGAPAPAVAHRGSRRSPRRRRVLAGLAVAAVLGAAGATWSAWPERAAGGASARIGLAPPAAAEPGAQPLDVAAPAQMSSGGGRGAGPHHARHHSTPHQGKAKHPPKHHGPKKPKHHGPKHHGPKKPKHHH